MKRMVILFSSKYKHAVCAYLSMNRVQYSMFTDIYLGEVRVSLPYTKGIALTAVLRRYSIPYEIGE